MPINAAPIALPPYLCCIQYSAREKKETKHVQTNAAAGALPLQTSCKTPPEKDKRAYANQCGNGRTTTANMLHPFLGAMADTCRSDLRIFRMRFRASLRPVSYSRCNGFWPVQLWTNIHIAKFRIGVPFLGAVAGTCRSGSRISRRRFRASLRPFWYSRCDGFSPVTR